MNTVSAGYEKYKSMPRPPILLFFETFRQKVSFWPIFNIYKKKQLIREYDRGKVLSFWRGMSLSIYQLFFICKEFIINPKK